MGKLPERDGSRQGPDQIILDFQRAQEERDALATQATVALAQILTQAVPQREALKPFGFDRNGRLVHWITGDLGYRLLLAADFAQRVTIEDIGAEGKGEVRISENKIWMAPGFYEVGNDPVLPVNRSSVRAVDDFEIAFNEKLPARHPDKNKAVHAQQRGIPISDSDQDSALRRFGTKQQEMSLTMHSIMGESATEVWLVTVGDAQFYVAAPGELLSHELLKMVSPGSQDIRPQYSQSVKKLFELVRHEHRLRLSNPITTADIIVERIQGEIAQVNALLAELSIHAQDVRLAQAPFLTNLPQHMIELIDLILTISDIRAEEELRNILFLVQERLRVL